MYNKNKDKELWKESVRVNIANEIIIGVYSYDDGEWKIGLTRHYADNDKNKERYSPIGRITLNELNLISLSLEKAKKFIQKRIVDEEQGEVHNN